MQDLSLTARIVTIDGHALTCAEMSCNGRKAGFKADEVTFGFAAGYFTTFVRKMVRQMAHNSESENKADPGTEGPRLAKFHFDQTATPNIFNNVKWVVEASGWHAAAKVNKQFIVMNVFCS